MTELNDVPGPDVTPVATPTPARWRWPLLVGIATAALAVGALAGGAIASGRAGAGCAASLIGTVTTRTSGRAGCARCAGHRARARTTRRAAPRAP